MRSSTAWGRKWPKKFNEDRRLTRPGYRAGTSRSRAASGAEPPKLAASVVPAELVKVAAGQRYPVIPEGQSGIDQFTDSATRLAGSAESALLKLNQLAGPDNQQVFAELLANLRDCAPLHDIGKVGIPDAVLHKQGKLSPEEYEIMKSHPLIGATVNQGGLLKAQATRVGAGKVLQELFQAFMRDVARMSATTWSGAYSMPHADRSSRTSAGSSQRRPSPFPARGRSTRAERAGSASSNRISAPGGRASHRPCDSTSRAPDPACSSSACIPGYEVSFRCFNTPAEANTCGP